MLNVKDSMIFIHLSKLYMEAKISISGAAENAEVTIPEMVDYLVCKGYKSEYSVYDFRRSAALLRKSSKNTNRMKSFQM